MLALQNAGGDNFVTPGEFAAVVEASMRWRNDSVYWRLYTYNYT